MTYLVGSKMHILLDRTSNYPLSKMSLKTLFGLRGNADRGEQILSLRGATICGKTENWHCLDLQATRCELLQTDLRRRSSTDMKGIALNESRWGCTFLEENSRDFREEE